MVETGAGTRRTIPLRAAARLEAWLARLERARRRRRKRATGEPLVTLVVAEWRLGDEVMAIPVYEALKSSAPEDLLAVRVRHPDLLTRNPHVDLVNPLAICPDSIIELRGEVSGQSRRTTLADRAGVDLGTVPPIVYLSDSERREEVFGINRTPSSPLIVLHPGSSQPCKSWPRSRWLLFADHLVKSGATVVEVGRGREPLGIGIDRLDQTSTRELARLLAQADVVVGEDSGPIHLALAVGTPAIGLFGATNPELLYPSVANFHPATSSADCRFCWPERRLAYPVGLCPLEAHECMQAIDGDEVVRMCGEILSGIEGAGH